MAAKLTPIKQLRRQRDAEVLKVVCNCDPDEGKFFRLTIVGNEVTAECSGCWSDYGPWYIRTPGIEPCAD
jgi:hypothetical protein